MTSEKSLEILFASNNYNGDYQSLIEAREQIEKDLERLEIYETFTIPNLKKLIVKLARNIRLNKEEREMLKDIIANAQESERKYL